MDSSSSGYEQILDSCEHGNEPMGVYKMMEYFLLNQQLLLPVLSSGVSYQNVYALFSHTCYMTCPSYDSLFCQSNYIWRTAQVMKFFLVSSYFVPSRLKYFPQQSWCRREMMLKWTSKLCNMKENWRE
jgi:hypothetical protein